MIRLNSNKALLLGGLVLLGALALVAIIAPVSNVMGDQNALFYYCALLLAFSMAAALFVRPELSNLTSWWIGMILLQFGVAPVFCKLLLINEIDALTVKSLAYVIVGTVAFWLGAKFVDSQAPNRKFVPVAPNTNGRVLHIALGMLAIGTISKFYMLTQGLFSYVSDRQRIEASNSYVQWLGVLAGLTIFAQIVLTIEYFQARTDPKYKVWFILVTVINVAFGLLSGMKGEVLVILVLIFLVGSLVTGKNQWQVAGIGLVLFFLLIPLNNFYREEVRSGGAITSLTSGNGAYSRAVTSANEDSNSALASFALEGAANRLNLLQIIVFVEQNDEELAAIEGDEKLWMIPFYPFVPRFLWKDKPILDKGRRMTVAMGNADDSSTAVTPFGDLLVMGGLPALFFGMFFVGITIQIITNLLSHDYGPKALFIYLALFTKFYGVESDIFMFYSFLVQNFCIALIAGYFIYGGDLFKVGRLSPRYLKFAPE